MASACPLRVWCVDFRTLWDFIFSDDSPRLAGLFSGLVSHIGHARWQYPRLIARLRNATTTPAPPSFAASLKSGASSVIPKAEATVATASKSAASEGTSSLGSSGAVYALFAVTALGFPDAEITLVIPPYFPINIQTGFFALVAMDTLGVLRGWR